jgi:phosphate transport system protein
MRETYNRELDALDQGIVRMGALVEQAIEKATIAITDSDEALAREVMEGDDEIDDLFADLESRTLTFIATQAPVASDLRLILMVLRAAHDLERSGDLAYNLAKVASRHVKMAELKGINTLIFELGNAARRLLGKAIDAWSGKDVELAIEVQKLDDEIDELYRKLYRQLYDLKDPDLFEPALNAVLVGRWYERVADHAVNIAENVRYYVTGDEEFLA